MAMIAARPVIGRVEPAPSKGASITASTVDRSGKVVIPGRRRVSTAAVTGADGDIDVGAGHGQPMRVAERPPST